LESNAVIKYASLASSNQKSQDGLPKLKIMGVLETFPNVIKIAHDGASSSTKSLLFEISEA